MWTRRTLVTGMLLGAAALGLPTGWAFADPRPDLTVLEGPAVGGGASRGELKNGEQRISALSAETKVSSADQRKELERTQREVKERVEERLAQVERIISGLTGAELTALERLEQPVINRDQKRLLASGKLGELGSGALAPSTAGYQAVQYAYQQLGKPYAWGAEGPESFDCSGLTSQAWASAGVVIPRVSQQQWKQLTHVPLDALRPGDLIIYFTGATHVAIYVGDGMVIQSPRPGAYVKISPIAANTPILGAVRPDPDDGPMNGGYESPPDTDGDDSGGDDGVGSGSSGGDGGGSGGFHGDGDAPGAAPAAAALAVPAPAVPGPAAAVSPSLRQADVRRGDVGVSPSARRGPGR